MENISITLEIIHWMIEYIDRKTASLNLCLCVTILTCRNGTVSTIINSIKHNLNLPLSTRNIIH